MDMRRVNVGGTHKSGDRGFCQESYTYDHPDTYDHKLLSCDNNLQQDELLRVHGYVQRGLFLLTALCPNQRSW